MMAGFLRAKKKGDGKCNVALISNPPHRTRRHRPPKIPVRP